MLNVTRSIWRGKEQYPKTPAAFREVDVVEPLAALMRLCAEVEAATCSLRKLVAL